MSFFGQSKEKTVDALVPVKPQADINIFTVASGLLYEVSLGYTLLILADSPLQALRIHHDCQCPPQHEQHRQVLVYRELPLPILPRTPLSFMHPFSTHTYPLLGIHPTHG